MYMGGLSNLILAGEHKLLLPVLLELKVRYPKGAA